MPQFMFGKKLAASSKLACGIGQKISCNLKIFFKKVKKTIKVMLRVNLKNK